MEGVGNAGVGLSENLLSDCQRALEEPLRVSVSALAPIKNARLLSVQATSGWFAPFAFSVIERARL